MEVNKKHKLNFLGGKISRLHNIQINKTSSTVVVQQPEFVLFHKRVFDKTKLADRPLIDV